MIKMSNNNNINYFELPATANSEQLRRFYDTLFNWKFEEGKDTPDYWYTENAGMKGAILKKRVDQQKATFYVEVESLDECISKAKNAGAEIILDKQEISEGYYSLLKDPEQNIIGIWEKKN